MFPIAISGLRSAPTPQEGRQQPVQRNVTGIAGSQHTRICVSCAHADDSIECTCTERCSRSYCPAPEERTDPLASPDYTPPPVPVFRIPADKDKP